MAYDLKRSHKRIVDTTGRHLIVQDGEIFEFGSKRNLGSVVDAGSKLLAGAQGLKFCVHCGGTFPLAAGLEEHLYDRHRDTLVANLSKTAPRGKAPDEDALRKEAQVLAGDDPELEKAGSDVKAVNQNKAKTQDWKKPIGAK